LEWKENPNEDYWVVGLWWKERYNSCYNDPAGCGSDVIYKQQLTGCVTCPTQNWASLNSTWSAPTNWTRTRMYKCKSSEDSKCYLKVFSTYSIKNTWLEWKENPNEDYWVVGLWWKERYNSCYNDPAGCGSDVIYKQQLTGCVTCPTKNWASINSTWSAPTNWTRTRMYKCKSSEDSKCYLKVFSTHSIKKKCEITRDSVWKVIKPCQTCKQNDTKIEARSCKNSAENLSELRYTKCSKSDCPKVWVTLGNCFMDERSGKPINIIKAKRGVRGCKYLWKPLRRS